MTAPTSDTITLDTPTGKIAGTLLVPAATGRMPLVVIIAGSGPTDRNGNSPLLPGANNSLKLLAEGLAERGIASLRYDKRGVAASATAMVSEANLRFDMYADDAAGWIRRLRSDARFSTITVVGHSEGSLLGMLATQRGAADGYVSIAGAGRAADKILREQLGKQLPPDLLSFSNKGLDALLAGHTVDSVPPPLAVAVPAECAAVHDLVVASGPAGRDNAGRGSGAHRSGDARCAGSRGRRPTAR